MQAEEITFGEELAAKHVVDIQFETPGPSRVNRVDTEDKKKKDSHPDSECYRCGAKHDVAACRFKGAQCFNCGRKGHLPKFAAPGRIRRKSRAKEPIRRNVKVNNPVLASGRPEKGAEISL